MAVVALALIGCAGGLSALDPMSGYGPAPLLPVPERRVVPVVRIAPARGWAAGEAPHAADAFRVQAFARDLDHPRWLHVLPNGDVLVAETNAPPRPRERQGLRGWAMALIQKRAGAAVPSANRITLLRDADGDGHAELRSTFLDGLNSPFGMALVGDHLYVANTDALVAFRYRAGQTRVVGDGVRVAELPAGTRNHHWTRNVVAGPPPMLYVTVGSNSNAG